MTDNEIIKALECCSKPVIEECCSECPYHLSGQENCHKLLGDIIDLINRKQAEIERLQKVNDSFTDIGKLYSEIKVEAIKEFAKRLKSPIYINSNLLVYQCEAVESMIDDIVKEMVGETDD